MSLAKGSKEKLLAEVEGKCFYCGVKLIPEIITYDHIIPKHHNGSLSVKNVCACCTGCNGIKQTYAIEKFRNIMERLLEIIHYEFYFEKIGIQNKGESYGKKVY